MKTRIIVYSLELDYNIAETDRTHIKTALHECGEKNNFQVRFITEQETWIKGEDTVTCLICGRKRDASLDGCSFCFSIQVVPENGKENKNGKGT